jgi:rhodanese-related sulfurtransferase
MSSATYGITCQALAARFARGDSLAVLDVREHWERALCAIPVPPSTVDLHVPLNLIPDRLDEIKAAVAERGLVVYCHHGVRSRMVADWLRSQRDADVLNLEGGIDDWSRSVEPALARY